MSFEELEAKRRAPFARPIEDIKFGDFRVEALAAEEADYEELASGRLNHPELAIAMCAAYFMGATSTRSSLDFTVGLDQDHTWKDLIDWLDNNVDSFQLRFYPTIAGGIMDPSKPVFWLIKDSRRPTQRFLHDDLYPPAPRPQPPAIKHTSPQVAPHQ